MKVLGPQSCPNLCDPMDCSPPDSSVHVILQPTSSVGSLFLPQSIFLTGVLNLGLLHCRQILCPLNHQGSCTDVSAESQRIDALTLWCWRRLLRVPRTTMRPNQSVLKETNPEFSLERLMLKLKLQYFGHLMQTANSLENTLMLGRTEGRRRKG